MKIVLQRVTRADVTVLNKKIGAIKHGLVIFLGIFNNDNLDDLKYLINKASRLRIFNDENGNMNLSIKDVSGSVLVISQFTLCANTSRGRRPNFFDAANPSFAENMYNTFCNEFRKENIHVEQGKFGANMKVNLQNEGPVTIILDSKSINRQQINKK